MKKKELSKRVMFSICVLLGVGIINILVLCVLISKNLLPVSPLCWVIFGEFFIYIFSLNLLVQFLWKPYKEIESLYQDFIEGRAYEELFKEEFEWMPQWKEVMEKFRHLLNKQDAIKMSKKQAEYLALQNQINPHFLYNSLEAIRGEAICAGMDGIAETTEALSVFFRYSITGVDNLVTVEEELDNVENYFIIQHYRFGGKVKLEIIHSKEDEILQLKIPKLTIQPFVENAIYHGIEKKVEGGRVRVALETTVHKLMITISDNGVGMCEDQVEKINNYLDKVAVSYVGDDKKRRGGIAMKNVNSRIKLLFGEEYGIHIYSSENIGTDVKIILPKVRRGEYEERNFTD